MIRIPAVLIGLVLAFTLSVVTLVVGWLTDSRDQILVLMPLWSACGGFIAGRWASSPRAVPGLAVGLLCVAARMGLGLGFNEGLLAYAPLGLALAELAVAMAAGALGVAVARRAAAADSQVKPGLTPS